MSTVADSSRSLPENAAASSGPRSKHKRRRIGLACSACRVRKSRCDGSRPKCSACDELGFDCTYPQHASSANIVVGKEYLMGLEERLKAIEGDVSVLRNDRPSRQPRFARDQRMTNSYSVSVDSTTADEEPQGNSDDWNVQIVAGSTTDGIGVVAFKEEEDIGFFGPSSNIAFIRQISHAATQLSGNRQVWTEPSQLLSERKGTAASGVVSPETHGPTQKSGQNSDKDNIYALPSELKIRELLENYFSTTGLLYPYLHEQTFWETYEELRRNSFVKIRRTWLGLLNIVLALSSITNAKNDTDARKRVKQSDVYYQRACRLCDKQLLQASSLEAVQLLLVMGQYLQGTQKSVQAWAIHGLTVKAAFQSGLHSSIASKRFSLLEQEIRKRTWYGCVVLDRTLSMTFGRPASIPDSYVKLELPKCLGASSFMNQRASTIYSVPFFNATIALNKIMWNTISYSYGANIGCDESAPILDVVSNIIKIEQELRDWERTLPTNMSLQKLENIATDSSDTSGRFRVILTLRYHNLRLLLHRSVLVRLLDAATKDDTDNPELALLQRVEANCLSACVECSMDIIAIVSKIVNSKDSLNRLLDAWWFTLYYTFNAGLVLCASFLVYQKRRAGIDPSAVPLQDIQASIVEGSQALQLLDDENLAINTCAKYLRQLTIVLNYLTIPSHTGPDTDIAARILAGTNFHSSRSPEQVGGSNSTNILSGISPLGQGMDFGEFLQCEDLAFLNQVTMTMNAHTDSSG